LVIFFFLSECILREIDVVNDVLPFHESCQIKLYDFRKVRLELMCQYFGENIAHTIWQRDGVLIANAGVVMVLGNEDCSSWMAFC
jgi:hypothetical protein